MDDEVLDLAQELAEVGRLVDDDDVASTLGRFVHRIVRTVPDCDDAAIAVLAADRAEVVARFDRTDELTAPAQPTLVRELIAAGSPLHDSLTHGEPHRIGDLASDHRWPKFAAAAINAGYRSCLFLPLPTNADAAAAFTLLSKQPNAFGSTSYDVVLLFALNAGVAFDNIQLFDNGRALVEHLRTALSTRTTIGQAQGLLMQRYAITSSVAFDVLKRCSQDGNLKLRDLARELVDAHNNGHLSSALVRHGLQST
ncbi:GAF and ANTAR domain-containing protein [Kribbella shirazensis]|uniref:GAF domain-containing protein n=1 Tax=Kribbella shirazensis TaxID=1105143 RepID=A0A7X5VI41_9ACTN|nr:GAF and ANTAR domain-containing protein [Kribbella shirazensis]NIK61484.1 GAF domain-containing protein [Kribbella shirazensis]